MPAMLGVSPPPSKARVELPDKTNCGSWICRGYIDHPWWQHDPPGLLDHNRRWLNHDWLLVHQHWLRGGHHARLKSDCGHCRDENCFVHLNSLGWLS